MDAELPILTPVEVRVLGCLVEKELTTPEYYPLSLNALTNACNQKQNRAPVLALEEGEVLAAVDRLRSLGLAVRDETGGRVAKYMHTLPGKLGLDPPQVAVLAELLLRGPQTPGELRARADRMCHFADRAAVEEVLGELAGREPPLVARLPRQPGHKESRCAHLLAGEPGGGEGVPGPEVPPPADGRVAALEREVAELRAEMDALRAEVAAFKAQFE